MNPTDLYPGARVRFHPIVGGRHDGRLYTVKYVHRKADVKSLSLPTPGFRVVDP